MGTRRIRTFTVLPNLPERLQPLHRIAYNLWWSWNSEAVALFRRIDEDLFESLENSPIKLLGAVDQSRYEQLLQDDGFLAHMERVATALEKYLSTPSWFHDHAKTHPDLAALRIAYFSAEFGIHDSIPVYSG